MPRFGFVGDEEVSLSATSSKQNGSKIADPSPETEPEPRSEMQREESPPFKHLDSTEQRSSKESYTDPDAKAEIAPLEEGTTVNLKTLVEKEASRTADPDLLKEARDAASYVEGEQKMAENTVKAPVVEAEAEQELLEEVTSNWTRGEGNRQTARCISAIRNCLLEGMKAVTIANYVAYYGVEEEDQAAELKRVQQRVYSINKSLKEKATDLEDLISKGIPHQRNGVVFVHGDALQKTASVDLEEGMAALNLSSEKAANVTTQTQEKNENEQHWMAMWKDVKAELKTLREELKDETDGEVKTELKSDIDCLQKKKDEWALLLGMKE